MATLKIKMAMGKNDCADIDEVICPFCGEIIEEYEFTLEEKANGIYHTPCPCCSLPVIIIKNNNMYSTSPQVQDNWEEGDILEVKTLLSLENYKELYAGHGVEVVNE